MNILLVEGDAVQHLAGVLTSWGYAVSLGMPPFEQQALTAVDVVIAERTESEVVDAEFVNLLQWCQDHCVHCLLVDEASAEEPSKPFILPLSKPVSTVDLKSILSLLPQGQSETRGDAELRHQLQTVQDVIAGERRLVRRALEQFINIEQLADPAIKAWTRSANAFSGDVVLSARTPANVLHLMMVDDMCCGALSVVSTIPVISPFYRMTEKGFGIDAIAKEINSRLFRFYPEGQRVSATLVSIDFSDGVIHVWNGGGGSPILLGYTHNEQVVTLRSALGTATPDVFDARTDVWTFQGDVLFALGSAGLLRYLAAATSGASSLEALECWLQEHGTSQFSVLKDLDILSALDSSEDISLVLASCHRDPKTLQEYGVLQPQHAAGGEWRLSLVISPDEMRTVDVVPLLLGVIGQFETTQAMGGILFVVLSELYNNALDHGLLGLDSALKLSVDGMGAFLDERAARLAALRQGEIELSLVQESGPDGPLLSILCRDSGPGFDHATLLKGSPASDAQSLPYGRGLALISSFASKIEFNPAGNQLRVQLKVTPNIVPGSELS